MARGSGYEQQDNSAAARGRPADALVEPSADEADLVAWFAEVINAEPEPSALGTDNEPHDDDDDEAAAAMLSNAWRGGGTMSSDRWFRG